MRVCRGLDIVLDHLGVTDDNTIFYASRNEIFTIKDGRRRLLAWVEFTIQCLAAAHGWICVGGDDSGRFAYRRLGDDAADTVGAQVDEQIPIEFRSLARPESPEGLRYLPQLRQAQRSEASAGPKLNYKKVGSQIVNSITIQKIQPRRSGSKPETVALLSNNDRTVTVFSLDRMRVLKTLDFRDPMNHASVSADGSLLVACGDVNKAFFFRGKEGRSETSEGRVDFDWECLASPDLAGFPAGDHCFSTAFSPDGLYCTVASQSGMLAMYDVSKIERRMAEDEAISQQYSSSRPGTHLSRPQYWCGAIRSVAFSPASTQMLAYAEDKGRVCVANLAIPFRPPQVIEFWKNDPDKAKLEMSDPSPSDDPDVDEPFSATLQRLGQPFDLNRHDTGSSAEINSAADMIEDATQRRRLQELLRNYTRDHSPFPEDSSRSGGLDGTRPQYGSTSTGVEANTTTSESTNRAHLPPPRRRSSVVLGNLGSDATHSSSTHPSSLAPIFPTTALSASPSRLNHSTESSLATPASAASTTASQATANITQDPWRTISAAMASANTNGSSASTLVEEQNHPSSVRNTADQANRSPRGDFDWRAHTPAERRQYILDNIARSHQDPDTPVVRGPRPLHQRSLSISRVARRLRQNSNPQSSIEATLYDSHERLRELERDLEAIDREHASFTARASRLWQGSSLADSRANASDVSAVSITMQDLLSQQQSRIDRLGMRDLGESLFNQGAQRESYHSSFVEGISKEDELDIMGLSWAPDGSILYVATSDGIYKLSACRPYGIDSLATPQPM